MGELRNYVMLDRCNDRVGMQILISSGLLLCVLNFCLALHEMWQKSGIPPLVPVVLYDLVVMGTLIVYGLHTAVQMNTFMAGHTNYFVQARQDALIEAAGLEEMEGVTMSPGEYQEFRLVEQLLESSQRM